MRVRKPAEERKSEIVETALRLADKVGPDRLATGQIAEPVGLTQAALFRHFPQTKDLLAGIAARQGGKLPPRRTTIARRQAVTDGRPPARDGAAKRLRRREREETGG